MLEISAFEKKNTKIAYYDPFHLFGDLRDMLMAKLPLTNLHWHPADRPLRSIPSLDIDMVEETAQTDSQMKHQILGLSNDPYLKMIFVKCEDNDTYRQLVRKMIKEWLANNVVGLRDPTEWLIVLYVPSGAKSYSGGRFRSGVLDKIRNDFNSGSKKDRCIQIRADFENEIEQMEVWSEFISKIKEGVLDAFSKRVQVYEEEINKLEAKKNIPGWNFGTYFVMKEGLALSFDAISLYEDALLTYDELEQEFAEVSTHKTVSFLKSIGFDAEENVSMHFLHVTEETSAEIRHKIISNEISLFEFHCYLFARQASLLLYISKSSASKSLAALKIGELYLRLRTFVSEMSGLLSANQKVSMMIAEWVYNVVTEFYNETSYLDEGVAREVAEGRGEILLTCRKSLEEGAARNGWVIEGVLADISLQGNVHNESQSANMSYKIKREDLSTALESEKAFHDEYRRLTIAASEKFVLADRIRTVNRLSAQLALLEYQTGNYSKASKLLESIPDLYARQGWDYISTALLTVYVKCLKKDTNSTALLRHSVDLICRGKYLDKTIIEELMGNIKELSVETEVNAPTEHLFDIKVDPYIISLSPGVVALELHVKSLISENFPIHEADLLLKSANNKDTLHFTVSNIVLKANAVTTCKLTTKAIHMGLFQASSIQLNHNKLSLFKTFDDEELMVDIYPMLSQIWGELRSPNMTLVTENLLNLRVHFPFQVDQCNISTKSETTEVRIIPLQTKVENVTGDSRVEYPFVRGKIGSIDLKDIEKNTTLDFLTPFMASYDKKQLQLKVTVTYQLKDVKHVLVFTTSADLSLLIEAIEQDYFKMKKLYTKISISAKNKLEPITVDTVSLSAPDKYSISSPFGTDKLAIAFNEAPLNYVFSVTRIGDVPLDADKGTTDPAKSPPLVLTIYHHSSKEECTSRVWQVIKSLESDPRIAPLLLLLKKVLDTLKLDLTKYCVEGEIDFSSETLVSAIEASQVFEYIREDDYKYLLSKVGKIDWSKMTEEIDTKSVTYELSIPMAISHVEVVHSVELIFPDQRRYLSGVIPAKLIISSTRHWAENISPDCETEFYYDVQITHDTWSLTGRRRGVFKVPRVQGVIEQEPIELNFVPLQEGKLLYPKIDIKPVNETFKKGQMAVDYKSAADTVLIVSEQDKLTIAL